MLTIGLGILIPFVGTTLGAMCALFVRHAMKRMIQRMLLGFASGVMVAASIWSLILPALSQAQSFGKVSFVPVVIGLLMGAVFLWGLDRAVPHMHLNSKKPEGPQNSWGRHVKMILAVTLHNIPEGMAVGIVYAGCLSADSKITLMSATALSVGIALQNFPEGAIISLPLCAQGVSRSRAVLYGILSGVVEPVAALVTIWAAGFILPLMPYLLSFAAGAMLYVVVEELIPELSAGEHSNVGALCFMAGFSVMLILDVALG